MLLVLRKTVNFVFRKSQKLTGYQRDLWTLHELKSNTTKTLKEITCNSGSRSAFPDNSTLLPPPPSPSAVIDFVMLPAQRLLTGSSFIVKCHVTCQWEGALFGEKNPAIQQFILLCRQEYFAGKINHCLVKFIRNYIRTRVSYIP